MFPTRTATGWTRKKPDEILVPAGLFTARKVAICSTKLSLLAYFSPLVTEESIKSQKRLAILGIVHLCFCMFNAFAREGLLFFLFLIGVIPFLVIDSWIGGILAFMTHSLVVFVLSQRVRNIPVVTVYCRKGARLTQSPRPIVSPIEIDRPSENTNHTGTDDDEIAKVCGANDLENEPADHSLDSIPPIAPSGETYPRTTNAGKCFPEPAGLTPQLELTPPVWLFSENENPNPLKALRKLRGRED